MKLSDYIFGQKFTLVSPHSRDEIQARINEAAGSTLNPFGVGVSGWARWGRVRLRAQTGPLDYNAKPYLTGSIGKESGQSILRLNYRGPIFAILFFIFWYLTLSVAAFGLIAEFFRNPESLTFDSFPLSISVICIMLVMPAVLHVFGTRHSADELEELMDFLRREIDASVKQNHSLAGIV